jgi:hypothetical protein
MKEYIKDLTDNFIRVHHFDKVIGRLPDRKEFINFTTVALETNEVENMSPEIMGTILCSIRGKELAPAEKDKKEFGVVIHLEDSLTEMLQKIVSECLANVIYGRLNPERDENIFPSYLG